jgi:putative PIN family toxin of toxin-antitoxin system
LNIVLDTNVVLDWLHFEDPSLRELAASIDSQRVTVLANELTLDEWKRVLAYTTLEVNAARRMELIARYRSLTREFEMPPDYSRDNLLLPAGFPRCKDQDDQHFLALAFHARAHALVTKDKALLKLRSKVRRFELQVVHPLRPNELTDAT